MMQRFTAISLLSAFVVITGCESGSSEGPAPIGFSAGPAPAAQGFVALYAPLPNVDVGPYPNDIYNPVVAGTGSTLNVPEKITSPLAPALNTLDGFSTIGKVSAPFNAPIDPATLIPFNPLAPTGTETIFVLDVTGGVPLLGGLQYRAQISANVGSGDSVLEIVWLQPLRPKNTYAIILTSGIQSTAGTAAGPDQVFRLVRDAHLAGVMTGNPGLDQLLPAIGPLVDAGVNLLGLPGDAIVSAWSLSTQSISDVLDGIQATATAQNSSLGPMGITTADLGLGLPGIADLYAGYIEIPYFTDPTDPLGRTEPAQGVWINANLQPLTRDDPVTPVVESAPIPRGGILRIPVLASLPNAGSGQAQPPGGWPVAILLHGVTRSRTIMVTIADAFAQAGFGVVAIDLPLHGVTDTTSIFYQAGIERHFDADNVGPLGDLTPDGLIDDGWQIFNVANPLNARDHGRQAVSDLIHLIRTVPTMDFDGDTNPDLDGTRTHFVSVSLGSLLGMAFVALNTEFTTATMASPGGPFVGFLFDPMATQFGLPIRNGIEAQLAPLGFSFGTVGFDNFARDLQTVFDPVESLNYVSAAAGNHPIHIIEVLSDPAVTATLTDNVAALMGAQSISATTMDAGGIRGIVRFTAGEHTSFFNPAVDLAVTTEMQTQAVTFAVSGGTTIPVNNTDIVQ